MANGNGDGTSTRKGGTSRLSHHGMRRSCDACGRKKRRCDGGHPCSLCVRSESQCEYSKRRWYLPGRTQHEQQQSQPRQNNRDAVHAAEDPAHSAPGALVERRMLPLKRCKLRASPATGLVGMQENAFISDFFDCIGFLPLTNESQIREAMVKIMAPAYPRREAGFGADSCGEEGALGTLEGGGMFTHVSRMREHPNDPSLCTFWCAVALGALVKGRPIESVDRYSQLAKEDLAASRSGSSTAELATASAILTYLYSFTRDMEQFHETLELAESLVRASIEQGSTATHMGLLDLMQQCRKASNVLNESLSPTSLEEQAPLQLEDISTEGALFRLIAQSSRAFDHAVRAKTLQHRASAVEDDHITGQSNRVSSLCNVRPVELSKAIVEVLQEGNYADFEPLQETADRPRIRAGIGSLLINGTLFFEKAAKGDLDATLERLDRCVDVFERYPGLCRCMKESHTSHTLLAALAGIDDSRARRMYDRLRESHNNCRPSHFKPIPPLEEWQGVRTFCSNLHCSVTEDLVKSGYMKVFRTPSVNSFHDSAGVRQTASDPNEPTQSELFATGFTDGEHADLLAALSTSSWTQIDEKSECAHRQNFAGDGCADAVLAPPTSSFDGMRQPDTSFVSAAASQSSTMSAGSDGRHQDKAEPEDNEIAVADWLEVADAMSDAVRTL